MAHVAMVRTLMEEAEQGRLERGAVEYWSDPIMKRMRRISIEVTVCEIETLREPDPAQ